jgi:MerR family transcriptional regulator, light-induced transcriptional regulator
MWAGGQVQDTINTEISTPLRQALVSHVIPQLIDTAVGVYAKKTMLPAHSVALGRACVSSDHAAPEAYARSLLAQDFDIESLYLDTIPEAARLFHDWWEIDDIDFIQVTSGIFRLEELVYSLSAEFVMGLQKAKPAASLTALLLRPPASQHSLGLLLLSEYFKRYGWQVYSANQFAEEDMAVAVRSEWVDILGFSMSEDRQVPVLKKAIAQPAYVGHGRRAFVAHATQFGRSGGRRFLVFAGRPSTHTGTEESATNPNPCQCQTA